MNIYYDIFAYNIVNSIILLVGIISSILAITLIIKNKPKWYLFLPVLVWGLYLTSFYIMVTYIRITGLTLDIIFDEPGITVLLSALQRLDGVLTMLFMTILLAFEIKYNYFRYEKKRKK